MLTIQSPAGTRRIPVQLSKVGEQEIEGELHDLFQLRAILDGGRIGNIVQIVDASGRAHDQAPLAVTRAFLKSQRVEPNSHELDGEFFIQARTFDTLKANEQRQANANLRRKRNKSKTRKRFSLFGTRKKLI